MDALTLTAACILCATQPSVSANVARWEPMIAEASARFSIPESWIGGVMRVESDGQTTLNGDPITSPAGAMGLMQIMPNTYATLRKQYRLGTDPYDPQDNIFAGTAYLKAMYLRYGYPLLFAAYLAGPAHLDHYLFGSERLPQTVVVYVNSIVPSAISEQKTRSKPSKSHGGTVRNPLSNSLFLALKPASKSLPEPQKDVPERRTTRSKSIFVDADRPASLFIPSSSQNH